MTQFVHTLTHLGTVHTLFTSYDTVNTHFGAVHRLFKSYDTVHKHFDIDTHCSQAMTQFTHTLI